ncbi:marine proteobacterial sortase target protein [Magnetospira sp. QH-2]|uniref:marine proteobacterial sortase target protein n=1 Tax=Magnetospira sp. (strain QH-2) TaxID=1288970 RepID=UPI0003E81822|nr:marine proteobacterial sortase target protein [Magnetospira sp. QH-2]CCQ75041.1 conservedexported protein of unknown function[Include von Willebrand factor type A (VWA) domain and Vault protein inter-alpha-trypsin domain] [Magnetospira sp. QH-2]
MPRHPDFHAPHAISHRRRSPLPGILLAMGTVAVLLATAIVSAAARAEMVFQPVVSSPESEEDTPFLVEPTQAPAVATQIQMEIVGPLARTRVRQLFVNPEAQWVEGSYVFPLPEDAAVDSLRMRVDDRIIEGEIKEKEEARRHYETAKRQGKKASLVTQERPNLFTTAVANIPPRGKIAVEIGFQEVIRWTEGRYELRFPATMTPRYIPGRQKVLGEAGNGWGANTDQVPDAERITPPLIHPDAGTNPIGFSIRLNAGQPLAAISSPSHEIVVTAEEEGGAVQVTLKDGQVPADRDFVLHWTPRAADEPAVSLFTETGNDGAHYILAQIHTPTPEALRENLLPREVVFVVDTSGSMEGLSMDGARAALLKALDGLGPRDRFNIIRFSSDSTALFDEARAATPRSLTQARRFVANLSAEGGTEILTALHKALDGRFDAQRVRQIILLTDGAVGNEMEILSHIRRRIGDSRLFTIGIGSAPNSYLMRKGAELGRGTYTFIAEEAQVEQRMDQLFKKLEAPVLADLRAVFSRSARADAWPRNLPDLYAGEPLLLTARLDDVSGGISLGGWQGGLDWSSTIPLDKAVRGQGIARLWARTKIEGLNDQRYEGRASEEIRLDVIDLALTHQLVSDYTSLVAVDQTPSRPQGEDLASRAVPSLPPHGWDLEKLFSTPASAPPSSLPRKAAAPANMMMAQDLFHAQGATAADLRLMVGGLTLLIGAGLLLWGRRARGGWS